MSKCIGTVSTSVGGLCGEGLGTTLGNCADEMGEWSGAEGAGGGVGGYHGAGGGVAASGCGLGQLPSVDMSIAMLEGIVGSVRSTGS